MTLLRTAIALGVAAAMVSACGGSEDAPEATPTKPAATATPTATETATPTATPTPKPTVSAILKQARGFAKGTSYEAPVRQVTSAEPNGSGVDVQTKLYEDAEGKAIARKIAAPFVGMGLTPVRVYAANGDLIYKTP
jgi:ABC-type glycerol-3-phosphate transport system substrate-binding protein